MSVLTFVWIFLILVRSSVGEWSFDWDFIKRCDFVDEICQIMNTLDLLQPHLLSTADLRNLLKAVILFLCFKLCCTHKICDLFWTCGSCAQRQLIIPKLDALSRTELLHIFSGYAVPLHQRTAKSSAQQQTAQPLDSPTLPGKRNHHDRIEFGETDAMFRRISIHNNVSHSQRNSTRNSIAAVTNGCKKVKLIASETTDQFSGTIGANGNHKLKRPTNAMVRVV